MHLLSTIISSLLLIIAFAFLYLPPFILPVLWIAFLYRYISAKKKNKIAPDTVPQDQLKKFKTALIVLAIVTGVFILIAVGLIILLNMAVAYM